MKDQKPYNFLADIIYELDNIPHGPFGPWEDDLASWDKIMQVVDKYRDVAK